MGLDLFYELLSLRGTTIEPRAYKWLTAYRDGHFGHKGLRAYRDGHFGH
jgi:hypothetical protein